MEIYLVGGAVRDGLLGRPIGERDWVVTGTTPAALEALGFRAVGRDFPVFLHPDTHEEHALARLERKVGPGYRGFTTDFASTVTLEQDLARRDLTVNAMARAADGRLIDPYGGQADLERRLLRHVSPAFVEDPVRILRVARFAARFAELGFGVAPETMTLMRHMVEAGEVDALVPERVWRELERALGETQPRAAIEVLRDCGALKVLLPEVDALFGVPQPPQHHPEVDTGEHLLLALQAAAARNAVAGQVARGGGVAALDADAGLLLLRERFPSHTQALGALLEEPLAVELRKVLAFGSLEELVRAAATQVKAVNRWRAKVRAHLVVLIPLRERNVARLAHQFVHGRAHRIFCRCSSHLVAHNSGRGTQGVER